MEKTMDAFIAYQRECDERYERQEQERWKREVEVEEKRRKEDREHELRMIQQLIQHQPHPHTYHHQLDFVNDNTY